MSVTSHLELPLESTPLSADRVRSIASTPVENATPSVLDDVPAVTQSTRLAWLLIGGFFGGTAAALAVGAASLIMLVYTPAAVGIALFLYRFQPPLYVGFVWWIVFLTALVRRLVDYKLGYTPTNPVLLAPLLVVGISGLTLLRHGLELRRPSLFPFTLMLLGMWYGFLVGVINVGPTPAGYALLSWLAPLCFGFHLAVHWQRYPAHRRVLRRTFGWGTLFLGLYGIWQFVSPPPWDVYWIKSGGLSHAVTPEAFKVRIFGPMNSHGPFSVSLMAGLLIILGSPTRSGLVSAATGFLSLLLSLVRASWGGFLVGLMCYLAYAPVRRIAGAVFVLGGALLAGFVFADVEPFHSRLEARFQTFGQLEDDGSLLTRKDLYRHYSERIQSNAVGEGLGATGRAVVLRGTNDAGGEFGAIEHGLQDIFYSLGWPGGLLYCAGTLLVLFRVLRPREQRDDGFAKAARSIGIAVFCVSIFGNVFVAVGGTFLWGFLGVHLAAQEFRHARLPGSAG